MKSATAAILFTAFAAARFVCTTVKARHHARLRETLSAWEDPIASELVERRSTPPLTEEHMLAGVNDDPMMTEAEVALTEEMEKQFNYVDDDELLNNILSNNQMFEDKASEKSKEYKSSDEEPETEPHKSSFQFFGGMFL